MKNQSKFLVEAKKLQKLYHYHAALILLDKISYANRNEEYYYLKAQCYYQDLQVPKDIRFTKAIVSLDEIKKDSNEKNRLFGAIYKRKYEYDNDASDLQKSIAYYEEPAQDTKEDLGYGLGNLIYLYCLKWNISRDVDKTKLKEIQDLVYDSLKELNSLPQKENWNLASMATLYLFRGDFAKSKEHVKKYQERFTSSINREQEITLVQLVKLFDVLPKEIKSTFQVEHTISNLLNSYPHHDNIIESAKKIHDKIGLALSGGGFRASLYHIGLLMRLAELDLLHKVEVISTVSGGSIIGMMYYLMLKQEFDKDNNEEIDYKILVQNLRNKFLEGIQENIRMKAFDKKLKKPLTQRLGELYQEILYDTIEGDTPTLMEDIAITPKGFIDFNPHFHNFTLKNKVPRIIVNATLFNNGHNWQFTTDGMGENSYMYDRTIDKNASYPSKPYNKICGDVTIGDAIAASSAVPMLFDPIEFHLLRWDCDVKRDERIGKLQISDGGVYDNLGLSSLVNDECTHIIISDGSKQMLTEHNPSTFRLDVLGRTQDILMTKNRDAEYRVAKHLKEQGVIKGLVISHMKEDVVDTKLACLLDKVASIRTDLDAFHDIEANAIMYSGYKITSMQFEREEVKKSFNVQDNVLPSNEFDEFELYYSNNQTKTLKVIDKSSNTLFKALEYMKFDLFLSTCGCLILLILLWFIFFPKILLSVLVLLLILFKIEKRWLKFISNSMLEVVMKCISKYYLKNINKKYLDEGIMK